MRWTWVAAVLVLSAGVAHADDVDVELRNKVAQKEGLPALILHVNEKVANVEVELQGGGKTLRFQTGPQRRGAVKRFNIDPGAQAVEYTGTLTVKYPPGSGQDDASMALHFVAEVVRPLAISVSPGDLDLKQGTLRLTANRILGKAEVTLYGEDGSELASGQAESKGTAAGAPFTVTWKATSTPVLKLHVQVTDLDGFYTGLDLFPWRVDVPHQDVSFASGQSAIPPAETGKLDAALQQILPQVAKARAFADVRLFVVGHTDTVGSDASNQKLSEDRARAIASYFRAHGLTVGISYAGMGEKALLVNTPDETDEPRNRRAEYVLSVGEPTVAHASTPPSWKKL